MAEVQPAEGANNNNNNNIEFADAADEEEHAEYLKHAFGREQIYDIPDGAFDTPPITEDVFTPDLLAMHTTNSKFSAIDVSPGVEASAQIFVSFHFSFPRPFPPFIKL